MTSSPNATGTVRIRVATPHDLAPITPIYLDAFPAQEREQVAALAVAPTGEEAGGAPNALALVAEADADPCGAPGVQSALAGPASSWVGALLSPALGERALTREAHRRPAGCQDGRANFRYSSPPLNEPLEVRHVSPQKVLRSLLSSPPVSVAEASPRRLR